MALAIPATLWIHDDEITAIKRRGKIIGKPACLLHGRWFALTEASLWAQIPSAIQFGTKGPSINH
jgi:hypothetical protein